MTSVSDLSRPIFMGILNLTPDSFSDGDPSADLNSFLQRADELIQDGAHILDVGGESTRPGSAAVSTDEEIRRVFSFLEEFRKRHPKFPVSLDTKKIEVAKAAKDYDIQVLNDVSFLSDDRFLDLCLENDWVYVLMHSRGTPDVMTKLTDYGEGFWDVYFSEIDEKLQFIEQKGFPKEKLILDPGFGFAKTPEQCQLMVENLDRFQRYDLPLFFGISRKRFLQLYTGENEAKDRDEISAKLAYRAFKAGFTWIRTHNIKETMRNFER